MTLVSGGTLNTNTTSTMYDNNKMMQPELIGFHRIDN